MKRLFTSKAARHSANGKTNARYSGVKINLLLVLALFCMFLQMPVTTLGQNEIRIEGIYPNRLLDSVWNWCVYFV
mgnify:CR=1 FL=1